jgi:hypothetical protein
LDKFVSKNSDLPTAASGDNAGGPANAEAEIASTLDAHATIADAFGPTTHTRGDSLFVSLCVKHSPSASEQ